MRLLQGDAAHCKRCGKVCQPGPGNPKARLLTRSHKGYCANCALTAFLKQTEPLSGVLESQGPEMLRAEHVRLQIARLLLVGKSDATIGEIDIESIISQWGLPL